MLIRDLETIEKLIKLRSRGVENRGKWETGRVLGALGALLGIFGAFGREFLAKLWRMGARWAKLGSS